MQTQVAIVASSLGLLGGLVVAVLQPAAVPALLVTVSLIALAWAGIAFINPRWGPLPSRTAAAWVFVVGVVLLSAGGGCPAVGTP